VNRFIVDRIAGLRVGWDKHLLIKSSVYQEQDNRIDIGTDVFLVHSNDIVINEHRIDLAPDQVDNILFIRFKENMKLAQ
jgi:hypothetical protein